MCVCSVCVSLSLSVSACLSLSLSLCLCLSLSLSEPIYLCVGQAMFPSISLLLLSHRNEGVFSVSDYKDSDCTGQVEKPVCRHCTTRSEGERGLCLRTYMYVGPRLRDSISTRHTYMYVGPRLRDSISTRHTYMYVGPRLRDSISTRHTYMYVGPCLRHSTSSYPTSLSSSPLSPLLP